MNHLLVVAAGGALGASARHMFNMAGLRLFGPGFPWATLAVNVVGGFAMGLLVELLARRLGASEGLRLFLATGILGGFTTFSAFSLEVASMWQRGALPMAAGYAVASVVLSVLALFAGLAIGRWF